MYHRTADEPVRLEEENLRGVPAMVCAVMNHKAISSGIFSSAAFQ